MLVAFDGAGQRVAQVHFGLLLTGQVFEVSAIGAIDELGARAFQNVQQACRIFLNLLRTHLFLHFHTKG